MSELRPSSPLRRPETARPRRGEPPGVAPPTDAELEAISRHLVALPAWEGGSVSEDEALAVTLVRGPGGGPDATYAAGARWSDFDWPARLVALAQRMRAEGAWPSLLWCEGLDRPVGLDQELGRQGWTRVLRETVMWVGRASVVPHLDARLRIEAVQPRSLAVHESVEGRIFGVGAEGAERRRAGLVASLGAGRLRAWVLWSGDEPVAVARLSRGERFAALQGIGVVEGHRGQGYGTLITTIATRAGLALGYRVVWLSVRDGDAAALRTYERLGFRPAFSWSRWLATEDARHTERPA